MRRCTPCGTGPAGCCGRLGAPGGGREGDGGVHGDHALPLLFHFPMEVFDHEKGSMGVRTQNTPCARNNTTRTRTRRYIIRTVCAAQRNAPPGAEPSGGWVRSYEPTCMHLTADWLAGWHLGGV
jgi:hypothetical protein